MKKFPIFRRIAIILLKVPKLETFELSTSYFNFDAHPDPAFICDADSNPNNGHRIHNTAELYVSPCFFQTVISKCES